jgi:hypothetical protein
MDKKCIICSVTDQEVPLVHFTYRNRTYYICPAHLPVMIHNTAELIDTLNNPDREKAE